MSRNNLIFTDNFSDSANPYKGFETNQDAGLPYSKTILAGAGREGGSALRMEVRFNDPRVSSGTRSEIVPNIPGGDAGDMWYGFSAKIEKVDGGWGGHCVQWHPNNGTGSANVGLWPYDKTYQIIRSLNNKNYYQADAKAIVFSRWDDYVFHIKWATNGTGLIEVWLNGAKVYNYAGQNTESSAYMKFGINRFGSGANGGPSSGTWIVLYSNLRIGRNTPGTPVGYNDVAPGDVAPPPANLPPIANAGGDINIKAPVSDAVLNGSGSDSDGQITGYKWSMVSGDVSAAIESPNSATSKVSGLKPGAYRFKLQVTDNAGATAIDEVAVLVDQADPEPPPVVNKLIVTDKDGNEKYSAPIDGDVKIVME